MQVHRYSDNLYRSFSSTEEAVQAFNKFVEEHGDSSHNAETLTSCSSTSTSKDACLELSSLSVSDMHYQSPTSSTITWFIVRAINRQIPICMQQHLIEHVYFTAQLFHGNNAPWEVDVQGLLLSTGWVDFCEALDIKPDDEIVFRHMGLFKFQFFIFRNGERVAILDAQGDGIERNPHLEKCKSLLVTSYGLQSEPGQLLSFIYNTEPEDEGVNVFHGDKHVYFHSRDYNYGDSFEHLKFILTENNP
nr:hypothetical protein Iba_chr09eCG12050 [Ipomoea batatas]